MEARPYRIIPWLLLLAALLPVTVRSQVAVRGEMVYSMAGPPIRNGVVLIRDGKIQKIGPGKNIRIPDDYEVYEAVVVTPGLVDARATVGLSGIYNQKHDQDQLDKSAPIQPELRASDAYNPREELVFFLRTLGVTTVHTGPAPGALISGQTLVAKTSGLTIDEVMLSDGPMICLALGPRVSGNFKSPGTRSKGVAMLRADLVKAREYLKKMGDKRADKRPAVDLKMEALARLLSGEAKALIHANASHDIMSAIRLAREFDLRLVLDGAAEAYLLIDEIRASGAEVILHPTMARASGEMKNMSMETAGKLTAAGIQVAIQSGYEAYVPKTRVVLYEAAIAAANGLGMERALETITINAARIIGQDKRIGSLEAGKDADLVLFDGDPFEYTTKVCAVFINGELVHEACK